MTNTEKKGIILDALQKAIKLVENCEKPYSDKACDKFVQKVCEMTNECQGDKDLERVVYFIMSPTFDYLCKMTEGEHR